ncbi:hypothetical protein JDFnp1_148 [Fusobacterium phage JD-Fnp1]|nr:hypothetical protein JDFnp1_148 [Fusobacterium phage JD-Fnp1]
MKKNYSIEEARNLMEWIERNKSVTDEIDRTIILADVIYRILYKVSLERYLANGGENTIKVEDEFFHILPPNSIYKTDKVCVETKEDEYKVFHINKEYSKSEVAVEYGMVGFMRFYIHISEKTKTNQDILDLFYKYKSLVAEEVKKEEEAKKYTEEEVNNMSDAELEALAGIIKTDGKTKTIIDGKEVEVKIVENPTREEIEAENKYNEDPAVTEMKRQVAKYAKSPESSLIPEGAKLKEEKTEEKSESVFGKNAKPTVTLKKAGDKGVQSKKPDFSKATRTASADTPSPIEGIPAMFALNDVAKGIHDVKGGSVKIVKGENGKVYAEPMKADDMKRVNDTIFPKEAYTHNTATGEKLGTPFGDEIMRVFNTSASKPEIETATNVVDFTEVDDDGEPKANINSLWFLDKSSKKLIPYSVKYKGNAWEERYQTTVNENPNVFIIDEENGIMNATGREPSIEENKILWHIIKPMTENWNAVPKDPYNDEFMYGAEKWLEEYSNIMEGSIL